MNKVLFVNKNDSTLTSFKEDIENIFSDVEFEEIDDVSRAFIICKKKWFDIVFVDFDNFDSFEIETFLKSFQSHILTKKMSIIFVSEDKDEFIENSSVIRGYDFILKPIDSEIFKLKLSMYDKNLKCVTNSSVIINDSLIYTETDKYGRIVKASKKFEQISGYTQEELLGKTHSIVRHPSMQSSVYKEIWETITSGAMWEGVLKNKKKNGDSYFVKAAIYPIVQDGSIIGYASTRYDITKELREKHKNKKILDAQKSLIILLSNKKLTYINKTLFDNYNYVDLCDFKSKHRCICELFEPYNDEALLSYNDGKYWVDYIKENPKKNILAYMSDKNGVTKVYSVHYRGKISKDEEIVVFVDVTNFQQQSILLQEQSRLAAMGEMISMIAHQWRQPITAMKALMSKINFQKKAGVLDDKNWDESYEKHSELIRYMSNTIDEFKDFFKGSSELKEANVSDLIYGPYRLVEPLFIKYNVKFDVSFEDDSLKNREIITVKAKTDQVIMNIYKNALDVFEEKKIENGSIKVVCFIDKSNLVIKINDNAGGIPIEILDKVFDPYFSTKGENGTGIGLYMSKMIIENHLKGRLKVSNRDEGACFSVVLPI